MTEHFSASPCDVLYHFIVTLSAYLDRSQTPTARRHPRGQAAGARYETGEEKCADAEKSLLGVAVLQRGALGGTRLALHSLRTATLAERKKERKTTAGDSDGDDCGAAAAAAAATTTTMPGKTRDPFWRRRAGCSDGC